MTTPPRRWRATRSLIFRVARKKGIIVRREDELHITIGARIREERRKKQLTLKQMHKRAGLSVSLLKRARLEGARLRARGPARR